LRDIIAFRDQPARASDVADDILAEFLAHVEDQHIDGIAFHLFPPAIEAALNLLTRKNHAWPLAENPHQRKLLCRKRLLYGAKTHPVFGEIEGDVAGDLQRAEMASMPTHDRAHAGQKLGHLKRLEHVIIGPEIEPGDTRFQIIPRCQHQKGRADAGFPRLGENGDAIHLRQAEIKKHKIMPAHFDRLQSGLSILDPINAHSPALSLGFGQSWRRLRLTGCASATRESEFEIGYDLFLRIQMFCPIVV
jgi:hypothetical protein